MPVLIQMLLRDLVLAALAVCAVRWSHELEAASSVYSIPVGIVAGTLVALAGYLVHEWGHLTGAWLARSAVQLPRTILVGFLFKFNSDLNSTRQFLWMSCGGFVASAATVGALLVALSFDHLADQVALGLTVLGVAAIFVLEFPAAWKVYRGGSIPRGVAYSSAPQQRR